MHAIGLYTLLCSQSTGCVFSLLVIVIPLPSRVVAPPTIIPSLGQESSAITVAQLLPSSVFYSSATVEISNTPVVETTGNVAGGLSGGAIGGIIIAVLFIIIILLIAVVIFLYR